LVAVHEIGHALGLDHTYNEKSIMYPSYQPTAKKNILPQPDRDVIQQRYGKKQSSSVTSTTTRSTTRSTTTTKTTTRSTIRSTTTTTTKTFTTTKNSVTVPAGESHPRCRRFLDAAFNHPDGTLHTLDAGILWRYLPNENTWENGASLLRLAYPQLTTRLAAGAYNSDAKQIVFFTSKDVYRYDIDHRNQVKFRNEQS
jgi:hypothetical protein